MNECHFVNSCTRYYILAKAKSSDYIKQCIVNNSIKKHT